MPAVSDREIEAVLKDLAQDVYRVSALSTGPAWELLAVRAASRRGFAEWRIGKGYGITPEGRAWLAARKARAGGGGAELAEIRARLIRAFQKHDFALSSATRMVDAQIDVVRRNADRPISEIVDLVRYADSCARGFHTNFCPRGCPARAGGGARVGAVRGAPDEASRQCPACGRFLKFGRRGFARHHALGETYWCLNTGFGHKLAAAEAPYRRR